MFYFSKTSRPHIVTNHFSLQRAPGSFRRGGGGLGGCTGGDVDHSFLSRTEVRNGWHCASPPPIRLNNEDRDNFTYYFIFVPLQHNRSWTAW
jgi:hypothetical protein